MNPRTLRAASIFGGVLLAGLALLGWSQPWFVVVLGGQSAQHPDLHVAGDVSAPAVAALAIAAAAAFGAMAISGAFFRAVLAVLEVLLGASILVSSVLALSAPSGAVEAAVTKATSVAGLESVQALIASNTPTAWPFVTLGAGALLGVLGFGIVLTGRLWPAGGRRFEVVRFDPADPDAPGGGGREPRGAVSDWDELSGGSDPTSR